MIQSVRRALFIYTAIAGTAVKVRLAYNLWVWSDFFVTLISMFIFVYFWRAVYAGTTLLGGMTVKQTITYVLLARLLAPLVEARMIMNFGFMIRNGRVAVELARPLDLQLNNAVQTFAELAAFLVQRLPIFLFAWLFFGLQLPPDLVSWGAFVVSLLLGAAVVFLFDWMFACLAFYTTETWGLSVVRVGVGSFFSGALVPLAMMPGWLQHLAAAMPFAQAISVPISFLIGTVPLADVPRIWLIQLLWLAGLWVASRWAFNRAVRKVTVQGG
jgi:ABC-2 type transport system permease protein